MTFSAGIPCESRASAVLWNAPCAGASRLRSCKHSRSDGQAKSAQVDVAAEVPSAGGSALCGVQISSAVRLLTCGKPLDAGCWKGIGGAGCSGHHGIDVSHGAGNLVNRFAINTRFVHDISVEWFAVGTAFTNGQGVDINLDLHR